MKVIIVFACILVAVSADCYTDVTGSCKVDKGDLTECNAKYGDIQQVEGELSRFANAHITTSFHYLLMSSYFGNYETNRQGFEKLYRKLSDSAWEKAMDIIKFITKRGGVMNFAAVGKADPMPTEQTELSEMESLAVALDIQKTLALDAHSIHHKVLKTHYDAEIASYMENEFVHKFSKTIRELSGHANDLKKLITKNSEKKQKSDNSLAVFLFDEYLQKVV